MRYQMPADLTRAEAERALALDDVGTLAEAVLGIGLYAADRKWAEAFCIRLGSHADEHVRGNAIPALGHLARRFGRPRAQPLVAGALCDPSAFVRAQAACAADDILQCTGWSVSAG